MNYKIGSDDPPLYRDIGSGVWGTMTPTVEARALRLFMMANIGAAAIVVGRHAAAHLNHYLSNTGKVYNIDLRSMINSGSLPKLVFDTEVRQACKFAETLPAGVTQITSAKTSGGNNIPDESKDWYYAVGAYQAWGKATVGIPPVTDKPRVFSMDFEYCFFDQYNWNGDGGVTLLGRSITDDDMGRFHKMGLAREFEMRASVRVAVEWTFGTVPSVSVPTSLDLAGIGRAIGL